MGGGDKEVLPPSGKKIAAWHCLHLLFCFRLLFVLFELQTKMEWQKLLDKLNQDLRRKNIVQNINSVSRTEKDVISCFIDNEELR